MDKRSPIQHAVVLRRVDPDRGLARFYSLMVERDLFGTIRLVRNWEPGRHQRPGTRRGVRDQDRGRRGPGDDCADKAPAGVQRLVRIKGKEAMSPTFSKHRGG
jgi:hypothetical protein